MSDLTEQLKALGLECPAVEAVMYRHAQGFPHARTEVFAALAELVGMVEALFKDIRWHKRELEQAEVERDALKAKVAELEAENERLRRAAIVGGAWKAIGPCLVCGYNGPGYYQPDKHKCADLARRYQEHEATFVPEPRSYQETHK